MYLRPFNFRAEDPVRHQHAVQYVSLPDFDWPQLRKQFPEEFENPVDATIAPTGWVPVRLVVEAKSIQIYVGAVKTPTLEVRRLGALDRGSGGPVGGHRQRWRFREPSHHADQVETRSICARLQSVMRMRVRHGDRGGGRDGVRRRGRRGIVPPGARRPSR